jgi:hypothetical protein
MSLIVRFSELYAMAVQSSMPAAAAPPASLGEVHSRSDAG